MHGGNEDLWIVGEVGGDALGIAALGGEIELAAQRQRELLHHFGGAIALQIRRAGFDDFGQPCEQTQVGIDGVADAGAPDLEHHRGAVGQPGAMRLRQRCGRQWLFIQPREDLLRFHSQRGHQLRADVCERQRRHGVLQLVEFLDPVWRQQIHARGQHLPKLDEGWTELFQGATDTRGRGHAQTAFGIGPVQQPARTLQHVGQADPPHHIAEAIADQTDAISAGAQGHGRCQVLPTSACSLRRSDCATQRRRCLTLPCTLTRHNAAAARVRGAISSAEPTASARSAIHTDC